MRLERFTFLLALVVTAFSLAGTARAGFPVQRQDAQSGAGAQAPAFDPSARKALAFGQMSSTAAKPRKFSEDSIIVKFKPGVAEDRRANLHKRHGSKVAKKFDRLRMHHVKLKKGKTVEDALKAYRADPDVEYAEPDFVVHTQAFPNDPSFGSLWGMNMINAPAAWDTSTGSSSVVVAVIDTGIDYTHPDLAANIWVNPGEIAGNGSDDDGNGYIDDIHGIDAVHSNSNPMDDNFHGTHVAGTIGAVGNNGAGVSGVNWNVKLLACKAFDSGGNGSMSAIIECLEYVKLMKDRGVNIVATNNSWGGPGYSQALYDAIAGQTDILFVAAAGNDASDIDKIAEFPGGYDLPNIITVAATDSGDNLAGFSNTGGKSVHVGAPGVIIYSTTPGNGYQSLQGTSMATPHVAGLAALLSATGKTTKQVKNLILSGAVATPALAGKTVTGGRIDALNSITCSNRPLLIPQHLPEVVQAGVPITLSILSINCGNPVGPVTVTLPGGGTMQLLDGGAAPDKVAGDGLFTGSWTPPGSGSYAFTITTPVGVRTVAVPAISVSLTANVAPPAAALDATIYAATGSSFSSGFSATGGILPYTWSVDPATLPTGVTLDSATGEIHGVTGSAGVYPVTIRATDSLGISDYGNWTLVINQGTRPGWPKALLKRTPDNYAIAASPVFADLDGDGKQEIIVADLNSLYVYNESARIAKYDFPSNIAINSAPAVADLFNDGRKQIIVSVGWPSPTGALFAFDKDLNLLPGFPAGAYPTVNGSAGFVSSPVVADFDGDGSKTILVACTPNNGGDANSGKTVLVMVDPSGTMVPGWPVISGAFSFPGNSQPAVADLDRDGKKEIVVLGGDGVLRIFHKDGSEIASWVPVAEAGEAWSPVLADFNGDGFPDIAVKQLYLNSGTSMQRVSLFDRTGAPLPGWPKDSDWNPNLQIIAADLDGDGSAELIASTGGNDWGGMTAYLGDGSTVPNWPIASASSWLSVNASPVAGDLTGSGGQDILYSVFSPWIANTLLWGYSGAGALLDGYPKNASLHVEARTSPALGDLDGNGRVDIAVKANDGTLHLWEAGESQSSLNLQWPMFGHDAQHTGALPTASGANFSAFPLSGYPPLLVSFADASTNSPVSWSWSFGDGATSTLKNPQHSYTLPGSYSVILTTAGPQGSATKTRAALITVNAAPTITTSSLPATTQYGMYSQMLTATGGASPYTWSVSSGSLPSGMTLDGSTGLISGMTSEPGLGTVSFTMQVADANGATATKPLSIFVYDAPGFTTESLPAGFVGVGYSQAVVVTGGRPPIVWNNAAGDLPAWLHLDSSTGVISGTPTSTGTSNPFWICIHDASDVSVCTILTVTVKAVPPLAIITSSLPSARTGVAYNQGLSAVGGVSPYTWSVGSGSLPDGLTQVGATISGIPAGADSSSFTITVTDATGATATKTLTLTLNAPLAITTPVLPAAGLGSGYSLVLNATGGVTPYTWSLLSGALPPGLGLSPSGMISGTPSSLGTWSFAILVTDANGATAQQARDITVALKPLVIGTLPTSYHSTGASYLKVLTASGGVAPYAWSFYQGQMPPGVHVDASGAISGTPTAAGFFSFKVKATSATGAWVAKIFNIIVSDITMPASLPWGSTGNFYSQQLTSGGGTAPYSWSNPLTSTPQNGRMPGGLSLSPSGIISGIPTTPGTYSMYLEVEDSGSPSKLHTDWLRFVVTDPSCVTAPVRLFGEAPTQYNDITSAHAMAANNEVLQLRKGTYTGEMTFYKDIHTALDGGFDCGFLSNEAERSVIVDGRLLVKNGSVKIDKLSFQ